MVMSKSELLLKKKYMSSAELFINTYIHIHSPLFLIDILSGFSLTR